MLIPFVDAHVNLWELGNKRFSWLMPPFGEGPADPLEAAAVNFALDAYLAAAKNWNVRGVVDIDDYAHPDDALTEAHWLRTVADERGLPDGIVAFAALNDPNVEHLLSQYAAHKSIRGVRHVVAWHPDPSRTFLQRDVTGDADWQAGFGLLEKYNFSFDCQVYPSQISNITTLIDRYPRIPVILNHLGMPVLADTDGETIWREGLQELAARPNTYIKISGLRYIRRPWKRENIRSYIRTAIEIFGPGRCLFGSDFPIDKVFASFNAHMDAYHSIVSDLSEEGRRDMFGRNANSVYRLGVTL